MNILDLFKTRKNNNEGALPSPKFDSVGKPQETYSSIPVEPIKSSNWNYFLNSGFNTNEREKKIGFQEMRELSRKCVEISTCLNTYNSYLSRVSFDFRDIKTKKNNLKSKKVSDIFKKNKNLHFKTLLELIVTETCVTDALTIYPVKNLAGEVTRFRVLAGETIQVVINDYQEIVGYSQMKEGRVYINFNIGDLCYMPKNVTSHNFYGCSYVEQLAETANLLIAKRNETKDFYEKGNIPNILISLPESMNPEEVSDFEKYWNMVTKGISKSIGKFIPGGSTVHMTREKTNEKDEQIERYQREVFSIFRLNPSTHLKDANRATAQVANQISEEVGMIDMLEWIRHVINNLIHNYICDDSVECFYAIDSVVDQEKEARINQIYLDAGVLKVNEVREILGKEPLAEDELPENLEVDPEQKKKNEEVKGKGFFTDLITKSKKDESDEEILYEPEKENLSKIVGAYLVSQKESVIELIKNSDLSKINDDLIDKALELPVKRLDLFVNEVNDTLMEVGFKSIDKTFNLHSVSDAVAYEKAVAKAEAFVKDRSAELIGKRLVNGKFIDNPNSKMVISETTRASIKEKIAQAIEDGLSNENFAIQLSEDFNFSEARALTIARTETSQAFSQIKVKSAIVLGDTEKLWMTSGNGDSCDKCVMNEKQGPIDINKNFADGSFCPPAHPNCKSTIVTR